MKNKIKILLLVLLVILLVPIIIMSYYNTPLRITINDNEYIIYKDTEQIDLVSYNANDSINITKNNNNFNTSIANQKLKAKRMISIPHQKINKDNYLTLNIKYLTGKKREIKINILPSTFPELKVEGQSKLVGDYYLSTIKDNTMFNYQIIINEKGEIAYYRLTPNKTYYFTKQDNDTYTYIEDNNLIILDSYFNLSKSISNVKNYLYINNDEYITYYDNKLSYLNNEEIIWELEEPVGSMSLDLDGNILIVDTTKNIIKKISIKDGKVLWKITNKKIKEPLNIVPTSKNKYTILTSSKRINIELNKKNQISTIKVKDTNLEELYIKDSNTLKKYKNDNNTIIEDNDIKIEINCNISSISKE